MGNKQWYELLFENYAEKYDKECFAQGTKGECDFLDKELANFKSGRILDIGCGTGRHSIELAKRGYAMTGIDLSASLLEKARSKSREMDVIVDFILCDARKIPFEKQFDAAIMICEGGFPLMETDEMNYEILAGISRALKNNAKFIFTTLNGLFPIYHSINDFCAENTEAGNATYHNNTFDLMTFRDHNITKVTDDKGVEKELHCNERYYIPSEITWLLKTLGFTSIEIFGAKLGAFSRNDNLKTDDFEMLVIAER